MGLNETQKQKAMQMRDKLSKDFDPQKAKEFIENMKSKSWYDDFKILYNMVTDSSYTISTYTKVIITGALAYVILPIDVIPDFIPVIGWIDDIFVLNMTINSLKDEIENYKREKNEDK